MPQYNTSTLLYQSLVVADFLFGAEPSTTFSHSHILTASHSHLTISHSHSLTVSPPPRSSHYLVTTIMSSPPTVDSTRQQIAAYYNVNYHDFLSHRKRLKDSGDTTKTWDRLYDAFRSHCVTPRYCVLSVYLE